MCYRPEYASLSPKWDTERAGLDPPQQCLHHLSQAAAGRTASAPLGVDGGEVCGDDSRCRTSGCVLVESMLWWTDSELSGYLERRRPSSLLEACRSSTDIADVDILHSGVQTRRNALRFQRMLIAAFTLFHSHGAIPYRVERRLWR